MTKHSPRAQHGELQRQVMELAWASESCTVRQIHDELGQRVAYTTVQTVMARLVERGLLDRDMHGNVWHYRPVRSDDAAAASQLVDQLFGRFGQVAVVQFVEHAKGDPQLFAKLAALVRAEAGDA